MNDLPARRDPEPELRILSSAPSMVTGRDALVEARAPVGAQISLRLNDVDVTAALQPCDDPTIRRGLIVGFEPGPNKLTMRRGEAAVAELAMTAFPSGGPVFSGPHLHPWQLSTEAAGLGAAADADGNVEPRHEFFYRSTATGDFEPYDPGRPPAAAEVATTTTDAGVTVPYIVRRETGASNRSIYQLAVLWDPAESVSPVRPPKAWNHKVHLHLQGGAGKLWGQGILFPPPVQIPGNPEAAAAIVRYGTTLLHPLLCRGFMVVASSNIQAATCLESVRAAESLMMLKEHIVKHYGSIRYTIAAGPSGGAMLQQLIANQYPGLLQGIIPLSSLPSVWDPIGEMTDSYLLANYFSATSPQLWTSAADRLAVDGRSDEATTQMFSHPALFGSWQDPRGGMGETGLPARATYDPERNPGGARATMQDYQVNYWGTRPQAAWSDAERAAGVGFARLPWDNVGVQYGLGALLSGAISVDQFVDVNEKIGGVDIDHHILTQRTQIDPDALAIHYRGGFGNDARHMDTVAILDIRPPEHEENYKSHTQFHTWKVRERLIRAHGHAGNQVAWLQPGFDTANLAEAAIQAMDRWLAAVEADASGIPLAAKIVANKPADLVDGYIDENGNLVTDLDECHRRWPPRADARIVAANGALRADSIVKAPLKPLQRSGYPGIEFTDEQWQRLQAVFPDGVCDWSGAGVDETWSVPWLSYADGPGGRPITPSPVTTRF